MSVNDRREEHLILAERPLNDFSNSVAIGNYLHLKTRVLIVDDLKLMVEGLSAVFLDDEDIEVVGFAHNGKEAIEQIKELQPDVVVMDLLMPVMDGIEATKIIIKEFPNVKILILSSFEDDASISEVVAAGARGYALKSTTKELNRAIHSVKNGSYHFAPGIIDTLAKTAFKNLDSGSLSNVAKKVCTTNSDNSQLVQVESEAILVKASNNIAVSKALPLRTVGSNNITATKLAPTKNKTTKAKTKKAKKTKPEKPLFPCGDWAMVVFGVIFLSRIDGMGHHLGHAGLFLLMLALLARPIKGWWSQPLKHRRAVGIFAFAATVAHAIYATINILDGSLLNMFNMSSMHLWGMWAGIISLALMAPAAVTSFPSMQRKLGKRWRQIHLLTVPCLAIAVIHTVLLGPHYLANFNLEMIDHIRTYGVIVLGVVVLLLRKKIVWSTLKLDKIGKSARS